MSAESQQFQRRQGLLKFLDLNSSASVMLALVDWWGAVCVRAAVGGVVAEECRAVGELY